MELTFESGTVPVLNDPVAFWHYLVILRQDVALVDAAIWHHMLLHVLQFLVDNHLLKLKELLFCPVAVFGVCLPVNREEPRLQLLVVFGLGTF